MTADASTPGVAEKFRFSRWVYATLLVCAAWMLLLGGLKVLLMFLAPVVILQATLIPWFARHGKRGVALAFMGGWFPWMVLVWAVFFVSRFDYLADLNYTLQIVGAQFISTIASLVDRSLKAEQQLKNAALNG